MRNHWNRAPQARGRGQERKGRQKAARTHHLGTPKLKMPPLMRKTVVLFTFQFVQTPKQCLCMTDILRNGTRSARGAGGRKSAEDDRAHYGAGKESQGSCQRVSHCKVLAKCFAHMVSYAGVDSGLDLVISHFLLKSKLLEIIKSMHVLIIG